MLATLSLLLAPVVPVAADDSTEVEFSRDVQPILSQNCFACHGPDAGTRKADLRLDLAEGQAVAHELVARITSADDDLRMPPPETGKELSAEEIDVLTTWVAEGAVYEDHWSFRPIGRPAPPVVRDGDWPRGPLDRFVLAELEASGLTPAPEADRATYIRRVTFDLCGVPPSPADVAAFVADERPEAYEELVDRLLASDDYAERMTLAWMDAARYGDSSVHHADGPRDMWPWRDWVIDAYRRNMPFDRFTVEQLAGDLLPDSTRAQEVASGFNRNTPTSDEGGAIDEELRVHYMVDRVKTTSNVWLGLSMECAQCHDHKFDPISRRDYYRFFAFFNQSEEKGFQTRNGNAPPLVSIPSAEQEAEQAELDETLEAIAAFLEGAQPPRAAFATWKEVQRDDLLKNETPELGTWSSLGPFQGGNKAEAYKTDYGPETGPLDLTAKVGDRAWTQRADDADGVAHVLQIGGNSAIYFTRTITSKVAQRVAVSLGSDDSIKVWLNGTEVLAKDVGRGVAPDQERAELDLVAGENRFLMKIVNGGGPAGYYFKLTGLAHPSDVLAALRQTGDERDEAGEELLRGYYLRSVWEPGVALEKARVEATARKAALGREVPTVMVMRDLPQGRMTYVLDRGEYDHPLHDLAVEPGVLEHLLPLPEGAPANRLGLAQWLVHPDHPLTARVAVNRYWAMLFGRGLVPSVMDLGAQGDRPSHPALLDWLADDFKASGWDVQRMLRQIVLSATYRQNSRSRAELATADPENRLLGRAPRFRLHGEFIRDQALIVSGLLTDVVGGPGVKPYQPDGLWNEVSLNGGLRFRRDSGEKLYRKSMYIYWKRSAPMPVMTTFDAPTRETCVVQRQRTNTPLQALVTLNDVQFVEAARHLGARMIEAGEAFEQRLDAGFRLCTARPADELRRSVMRQVHDDQLAAFRADLDAANALLAVGESPVDATLDPAELATWTVIASMLFNLDETLTRD